MSCFFTLNENDFTFIIPGGLNEKTANDSLVCKKRLCDTLHRCLLHAYDPYVKITGCLGVFVCLYLSFFQRGDFSWTGEVFSP